MSKVSIKITHGNTIYEPPIEDDIELTYERVGSPGKLTFTVIKDENVPVKFTEGDTVDLYTGDAPRFKGYIFTISHDKDEQISVTCYDPLRYFKNKYTYCFTQKKASAIVKALCKDFNIPTGIIEDTGYVIPSIIEENSSALDICQTAIEETLLSTGKMFVLYADNGKICLRDSTNMIMDHLIDAESAQNFDYTSSIDSNVANSVVLYYKPSNNISGTATEEKVASANYSNGASAIVNLARTQIGTKESPMGSNNVKYNTSYYGRAVSGSAYPWCCAFIWWIFKEAGMSSLFYGGQKTAYCPTAVNWFKNKGQWVTKDYRAGDIVFFDYNGDGLADHVGIVESVESSNRLITIEGNYSDSVQRVSRSSQIMGAGRPDYSAYEIPTTGYSSVTVGGSTINIPSGLGKVHTYMGWQLITAKTSQQYKLRQKAGTKFDSNGYGKINGRYVIACTTTYGKVGDYVDFYQEDGTIIHGIIGDIKNQNDSGCNKWGHNNGTCIVEFVVDYNTWYPSHSNPGTSGNHPEWNQNITKAINYGSYFDNPSWSGNTNDTPSSITISSAGTKEAIQVYNAQNGAKIKEWGLLRHFEEIKTPSIGKTKAKQLLDLYCRKNRELKISDAVGISAIRGGVLLPVELKVGEVNVKNYMLVEKVTHKYKTDNHTMDLTLEGAWKD